MQVQDRSKLLDVHMPELSVPPSLNVITWSWQTKVLIGSYSENKYFHCSSENVTIQVLNC